MWYCCCWCDISEIDVSLSNDSANDSKTQFHSWIYATQCWHSLIKTEPNLRYHYPQHQPKHVFTWMFHSFILSSVSSSRFFFFGYKFSCCCSSLWLIPTDGKKTIPFQYYCIALMKFHTNYRGVDHETQIHSAWKPFLCS